uniref:uncharacterized protein LOC120329517 n=1 Tax=Styela clava TaxID=7725 RepID=UPI001939F93B|nr:uncharacterized protein LOC120329517 [Styela clava]
MISSDTDLNSPEPKLPRTESESEMDSEQELELCMDEMYVRQHFGTTSDELVDIIFNLSLKHVTSLIPTLKKPLMQLAMAGKSEEEKSEMNTKIEKGLRHFLETFYSRLEHNSDGLLIYLRDYIVSVPDGFRSPSDKAQLQYKDLVKSLQEKEIASGESEICIYTEQNMADVMKEKVIELREKLHQKKLEKLDLENRIQQADSVIRRANVFEEKVNSVLNSFQGSLSDFVQKNIAAAMNLPVDYSGTNWSAST